MTQNLIGLPVPNPTKIDYDTLDLNIKLKPYFAWSSILYPYPGTEIGSLATKIGFFDNDFEISEIYEGLHLIHLSNDSNYIIKGIAAGILYRNDPISKCYDKQAEIFEELKPLFPNAKIKKDEKEKPSNNKLLTFRIDNLQKDCE